VFVSLLRKGVGGSTINWSVLIVGWEAVLERFW